MKRFLVFAFVLCSASLFAQGSLEKGKAQINAGIGVTTWGVPIYAGFDVGVHEWITVGGKVSYRSYGGGRFGGVRYKQSLTTIGANGNFHFNELLDLPSKWDLYAGLSLGYYIWSDVRWNDGNNTYVYGGEASGLGAEVQAGARYFFTDKFGVNAELGGGTGTGLTFGVTIKL